MFRITVVDDDVGFQNTIRSFIIKYFHGETSAYSIKCFCNGIDFLTEYKCDSDLIIMDIQMPMMNGMEVAKEIRKLDENVMLIFITETAKFAINGYSVAAFNYILKPLVYETFQYNLERVIRLMEARKPRHKDLLVNNDEGKVVKISIDDIIYIAKEKDMAIYHTRQGVFRKRIPLFKIAEMLQNDPFAVVNSGCMVNLNFVRNVSNDEIQVTNGEVVMLSRGKKKEFYEKFFDYANSYGGGVR